MYNTARMTRAREAPAEGEAPGGHAKKHAHAPGASPRPQASGQHNSPQASPRCAPAARTACNSCLLLGMPFYQAHKLPPRVSRHRALFHALRQAHPSVSQPKHAHGSDEDEDEEWAGASAALREQQLQQIRKQQEEQLRHRLEERIGKCCRCCTSLAARTATGIAAWVHGHVRGLSDVRPACVHVQARPCLCCRPGTTSMRMHHPGTAGSSSRSSHAHRQLQERSMAQ